MHANTFQPTAEWPPRQLKALADAGKFTVIGTSELPPLIRALTEQTQAFPHAVHGMQIEETHISWVLLTGEFAYKIKKPVKLAFLDFSTLSLRRQACEDELRLNRRFAPELYLNVVPISGSTDQPRFGAAGPAIEYAVRMRQFPPGQQLDRLVQTGAVQRADFEAFGRSLSAIHAALPRADGGESYGDAAHIQAPVDECLGDLRRIGAGELQDSLCAIESWAARRAVELAASFVQRRQEGFVRECHGDLHMANLVRLERGIVPFDCIEFSRSLRCIDVLNDASFLLMDLCHCGRSDLAYSFINAYLEAGGDYAGLPVLHYYAMYRALVRAKIALIRQGQACAAQAATHAAECSGYVEQGLHWVSSSRPGLILMHGLSGSGKTRYSGEIASHLPAIRVRSDVERRRMYEVAPEGSGSAPGGGLYADALNEQVYARLEQLVSRILEGGETAIVDASFLRAADRRRFTALAQRQRLPMAIIECRAPTLELERRISSRKAAGHDASEADLEVLRLQLAQAEPLDAAERDRSLSLDTTQAWQVKDFCAELDRRLQLGS